MTHCSSAQTSYLVIVIIVIVIVIVVVIILIIVIVMCWTPPKLTWNGICKNSALCSVYLRSRASLGRKEGLTEESSGLPLLVLAHLLEYLGVGGRT